jgi:hypothetical protein
MVPWAAFLRLERLNMVEYLLCPGSVYAATEIINARDIDCLVGHVTTEIGHSYIADCTTVVGRMGLLDNTLDQD